MPNQVFLSHSKRDEEVLGPIFDLFAKCSLSVYQADFEELGDNPANGLREEIFNSVLLVVVLGPQAAQLEHTKMWISWEVGVMSARDEDIWVIEDEIYRTELPIPNLTDYLLWRSDDPKQRYSLRNILEVQYSDKPSQRAREALVSERQSGHEDQVGELWIECFNCGQEFRLRMEGISNFPCPTCREVLEHPG